MIGIALSNFFFNTNTFISICRRRRIIAFSNSFLCSRPAAPTTRRVRTPWSPLTIYLIEGVTYFIYFDDLKNYYLSEWYHGTYRIMFIVLFCTKISCILPEAHATCPSRTHELKSGFGVPCIISHTGRLDPTAFSLQVLTDESYTKKLQLLISPQACWQSAIFSMSSRFSRRLNSKRQ